MPRIFRIHGDNIVECEKYMDNIFRVAYSIGGDYGEKTLRSIAEIVLKEVKSEKVKGYE